MSVSRTPTLWPAVALLALGLAACGGATAAPTEAPTAPPSPPPTETPVAPSVRVSDQTVMGDTVTVDEVVAAEPGWMVIHAEAEGKPGPVIGYAPVSVGENRNVVVQIDPTGVTPRLFAMLHLDAGTPGEYEFPGDDAPVKSGDAIVLQPFAVTLDVEPSVSVGDQVAAEGTVTVDEVVAAAPGWMVIHAEADGKPGPVIGYTPVPMGRSENVAVGIDLAGATPTLFAMLHLDAGTPGEYEFPGDDVPVKVEEAIVVKPFQAFTQPRVTTSDQDASDGVVEVDEVIALDPGWMVIHAEANGAPGPVIGFAPVPVGRSENVAVEIDLTGATPTLFAMLHLDAGTPGEYEFPGDDAPVRVGDAIVVTPFQVDLP